MKFKSGYDKNRLLSFNIDREFIEMSIAGFYLAVWIR